jgi:hypothetical protein
MNSNALALYALLIVVAACIWFLVWIFYCLGEETRKGRQR